MIGYEARQEAALSFRWRSYVLLAILGASALALGWRAANLALRDHCREILVAIVSDMQTAASADELIPAVGRAPTRLAAPETVATVHGALRHAAGFDLVQVIGEFRALRSSVLWRLRRLRRERPGRRVDAQRRRRGWMERA